MLLPFPADPGFVLFLFLFIQLRSALFVAWQTSSSVVEHVYSNSGDIQASHCSASGPLKPSLGCVRAADMLPMTAT
jgi:hypothetical protein